MLINTMTIIKKDEGELRRERKIFGSILEPTKDDDNEYRIKLNQELKEEING